MHQRQELSITRLVAIALTFGISACGRIGYAHVDAATPSCDVNSPACRRDAGSVTLGCDAGSPACPIDGVPAEHGGRSYVWLEIPRTYAEATATCVALGGRLARIDDEAEQNFAWAQTRTNTTWIAGQDRAEEGVWLWPDDGTVFWRGLQSGGPTPGVYTNWGSIEPNNSSDEDCLTLWDAWGGRWADEDCERSYTALCESSPK